MDKDSFYGYLRPDGKKGIRNNILVVYTVECAHHVAKEIAFSCKGSNVQVIGFSGCYPNSYAERVLEKLCTHANTQAVLIVSLGCEGFRKDHLKNVIEASGRETTVITIQESGGTSSSIRKGIDWIEEQIKRQKVQKVKMNLSDLVIGAICGGSDATTAIAGNPSVGAFFDRFIDLGGIAIFEETGEMIGLENEISQRGLTSELSRLLKKCIKKAEKYYGKMGHGSFSPGNADGGLTTIEEKSLSSYSKGGSKKIIGILQPGIEPTRPGLYLLDVVPDGNPKFGYPNINDNAEISDLLSCGCHLNLFVTGRGSVVGSAVAPVIKITGNPETYIKMKDDMDVNAGKVLTGNVSIAEIADEILLKVIDVANGNASASEKLGHQEFVMTYKYFDRPQPSCLPN